MSDSWRPHGLYEAHQAPLSVEFSRQAYWSGLPCSLPGNLPDLEIKLASPPLQVEFLPVGPLGMPRIRPWEQDILVVVEEHVLGISG